jgi:hypothetical protein
VPLCILQNPLSNPDFMRVSAGQIPQTPQT